MRHQAARHSRAALPQPIIALAAVAWALTAAVAVPAADSSQPSPAMERREPQPRDFFSDEALFQKFSDGQPLAAGEQEALAELLFAVRRIAPQFIERWATQSGEFPWDEMPRNSSVQRGRFFGLHGHVIKVAPLRPPAELARRLELRRFFRCQCQVGPRRLPVVVYAAEVPLAWPPGKELREPVSIQGVYFKLSGGEPSDPHTPAFAAARLAWRPEGLLDRLGLDVGLLDGVRHNRDLSSPSDQEAFYQLLAGAGRVPRGQIEAAAEQALAELDNSSSSAGEAPTFSIPAIFEHAKAVEALRREADGLAELGQRADRVRDLTTQKNAARTDAERAAVAGELSEALAEFQAKARAANLPVDAAVVLGDLDAWIQGRLAEVRQKLAAAADSPYSQGRPMTFEGIARRAVRIVVDEPALVERLGFDHYFLVDVMVGLPERARLSDGSVVDDTLVRAQVRELPEGMPQGEKISARVRLSGVFLKLYPYVSEKAKRSGSGEPDLAPLLIGRDATWVRQAGASHALLALIATGLFLLLLGGIALWTWRTRRGDAKARAKLASRRAAPGSLGDVKSD
jgi:hypothetical protein